MPNEIEASHLIRQHFAGEHRIW